MGRLNLTFFNTFAARISGQNISNFRSAKVEGLLVYLALYPEQIHSRDSLADLLWPGLEDKRAKHNLRQSVYQLKKVLGEYDEKPYILTTKKTVQFNPHSDFSLDVREFDAAIKTKKYQQALKHYSGDLLKGFDCESPFFEAWLLSEREHWRQQAHTIFYTYTNQLIENKQFELAQEIAQQQLSLEPSRESAHQQLIRIFELKGDLQAALSQYHTCYRILDEDLNVKPSNRTEALHKQIHSKIQRQTLPPIILPTNPLPLPGMLPNGSIMPLSKNRMFVGRSADLENLATALNNAEQALTISQVETAAATGLGGIGKSQLASEFAHRFGRFFSGGVFWLSFENPEAIPAEIAKCGRAGALELKPNFEALSLNDQIQLVKAAWQQPTPRLLIFDNCEDPGLLEKWRPTSGGCRVIITSRRGDWELALGIKTLPLGVLARNESIALLSQHRQDLSDHILNAVAEELGDLPLALHLAGCYLKRYQRVISIPDYLNQLQDPDLLHHPSMQNNGGISPTRHVQHVGRTFALSYDQLDLNNEVDQLAHKLLIHAAHFAPGEPIWYRLLVKTLRLEASFETALQTEQAFSRLIELGLIETEHQNEAEQSQSEILRMHRLVAKFVRDVARESILETQQTVEEIVFEETAEVNASGYPMPLLAWQHHLLSVVDIAKTRNDEKSARLCAELGRHLLKIGDTQTGLLYAEKSLEIRMLVFGASDLKTAESLNLLGELYLSAGEKISEALTSFYKALKIQELHPEPNSLEVAQTFNLIGLWHLKHGVASKAIPYFRKAIGICEKSSGIHDEIIATYENNLGDNLRIVNELDQALPHLQRALTINEKLHDENHPIIAMNLNNIGIVLRGLNKLHEAQTHFERAISIRQETMGAEHPETALMMSNLGGVLIDMKAWEEAEKILHTTLSIFERAYSAPHPFTAFCLNNLGMLYQHQQKYNLAQKYFERALKIRRIVLAENHPHRIISLKNLGDLLIEKGQLADALPLLDEAEAVSIKA